jgi:tetratricopeptide (TPR) repeat protein
MEGRADAVGDDLTEIVRLIGAGDLKAAMDRSAAMMRRDPKCAPALHMMGLVAARMGDQGLALSFAERAHALEPDFREYPAVLAYLCATVGRLGDALYYAKLATVLAPHPLGELLMPAGLPMSRGIFDHVAVSMHWMLAEAAFHAGKFVEAAREAEAELRINPQRYDSFVLLARARHALGAHDVAQAHLRTATKLKPDGAVAYRWLGDVLLSLGEPDQALACHRAAVAFEVEDDAMAAAHALSQLPWQSDGNHRAGEALAADLRGRAAGQRKPVAVEQVTDNIGILWDQCHAGPLVDFLAPVLEHLDNVVLYRLNRRTDATTEALRAKVMRFQDCPDLDAATFDRIVGGDQSHVLINLCTSPEEAKFPALGGAAAPAVVQWLGVPMPDRLPGADLVIGAPSTASVDQASFGAAGVVALPRLLAWRFPTTASDAETIGRLPRDAGGQVTFGAIGDLRRATPEAVALWAAALRAVPGARLLLGSPEGAWPQPVADRLGAMFSNFGVIDRVSLQGPHESGPVNFDLFARVDVLLDSAPVNGMNDVAEALWMGVPVVTLPGSRRAGRTGAAILEAAGLGDWIAATPESYAALAAGLADAADLAQLRAGLRDRVAASPLCDAEGFAALLKAVLAALPQRPVRAA